MTAAALVPRVVPITMTIASSHMAMLLVFALPVSSVLGNALTRASFLHEIATFLAIVAATEQFAIAPVAALPDCIVCTTTVIALA